MNTPKTGRAALGFGGELEGLDLAEWSTARPKVKAPPEVARQAGEATGFRSREPATETPKAPQRRRRTGRNAQLNLKAKPETIAAFTRIADARGWGLGEAFEYATALLEREHSS